MTANLFNHRTTERWSPFDKSSVKLIRRVTALSGTPSGVFTVPNGQVFLIDSIEVSVSVAAAQASGNIEVKLVHTDDARSWAADNWLFRFYHRTGETYVKSKVWKPQGNAVLYEKDTLGAAVISPVSGNVLGTFSITGRLMSRQEALDTKVMNGTEFVVSNGALAGLTGSFDNLVFTNPTSTGSLEISSTCCFPGNAAAGLEAVQWGFKDATARFAFAQTRQNANPEFTKGMAVNQCNIRGEAGADLVVNPITATANSINPIIAGRVVDSPDTFEVTGQPQGAGSLAGRPRSHYFWFYKNAGFGGASQAADTYYHCFPRSLDEGRIRCVIRGYHSSFATNVAHEQGIALDDTLAHPGAGAAPFIIAPGTYAGAGSLSAVIDDLHIPISIGNGQNIALAFTGNLAASVSAITVWGTMHEISDADYTPAKFTVM